MRRASLTALALVWLCAASARAQDEPPTAPASDPIAPPDAAPPHEGASPYEAPPPSEAIAPEGASPYATPVPPRAPEPSSPYPDASPYPEPSGTLAYAPATAAAPEPPVAAEPPAPAARPWLGAFEARFGGSTGFAQLDSGVGVHRHHGWGGFVGMELAQPLSHIAGLGSIFIALTWNAIELRSSDPEGWVVGGTDAGAGVGVRLDLAADAYVQAWTGYFFAGDSQAVYPDAGDLLAMWHLAYLRARLRFGVLALELGGGVGTGEHFLVGLRLQLGGSFWLGADLNAYFAGREQHATRWGRELWIGRAFFALRWE